MTKRLPQALHFWMTSILFVRPMFSDARDNLYVCVCGDKQVNKDICVGRQAPVYSYKSADYKQITSAACSSLGIV